MIFNWRLGMACWMLASFFLGFALRSDGDASASAFFAAGCFVCAGVVQFVFDPPTSRDGCDGIADATAGE